MATRSSSRLNSLRVKAEQDHAVIPTTTTTTNTNTTSTRGTRRTIVKDENGEPDAETLARLKLEADEHRKALAVNAKEQRVSSTKRNSTAMNTSSSSATSSSNGSDVKKSKFATKEPAGWEITLDRLREFRLQNPAPVDTMGCERLAEVGDHIPPEVSSLSLSFPQFMFPYFDLESGMSF